MQNYIPLKERVSFTSSSCLLEIIIFSTYTHMYIYFEKKIFCPDQNWQKKLSGISFFFFNVSLSDENITYFIPKLIIIETLLFYNTTTVNWPLFLLRLLERVIVGVDIYIWSGLLFRRSFSSRFSCKKKKKEHNY